MGGGGGGGVGGGDGVCGGVDGVCGGVGTERVERRGEERMVRATLDDAAGWRWCGNRMRGGGEEREMEGGRREREEK